VVAWPTVGAHHLSRKLGSLGHDADAGQICRPYVRRKSVVIEYQCSINSPENLNVHPRGLGPRGSFARRDRLARLLVSLDCVVVKSIAVERRRGALAHERNHH
jgi:hypothetical protein